MFKSVMLTMEWYLHFFINLGTFSVWATSGIFFSFPKQEEYNLNTADYEIIEIKINKNNSNR